MKTVKFIKAHPVGIPENAVHTVRDSAADRWIAQGYAVEETGAQKPDTQATPDGAKPSKSKKGEKKK